MRSIAHLRLSGSSRAALNTVLAACARATSVVEPADEEVFLDLSAPCCKGLWRELWREVKESVGAATMGLATSKLVARVASGVELSRPVPAQAACPGVCAVRPGKEAAFLAPLSIDLLWMAEPSTRESLHRLGFHTIGSLAAAPAAALRARFGHAGLLLQHGAHGLDPAPVQALYPPACRTHRISCGDHPWDDQSALEAAVERTASALIRELADAHQAGGRLTLALVTSSGTRLEESHERPCGALWGSRLGLAARQLLRRLRVSEPVEACELTVAKLAPVPADQSSLFASLQEVRPGEESRLDAVVSSVRELYGGSALQRATALAPPRRDLVLAALEQSWLG